MHKLLQKMLFALTMVLLLAACRKKAFEEYYGRPDTLEPPIYQQLATKGNFTHLLAAIDKAGYKPILGAAGYWTFFAPHDSAFQVYFSAQNIKGIEDLDSNACRKLVTYCLVYNAFRKERIGDYQSATGWVAASAFRRRTANYAGVYDGKDNNGNDLKLIGSNRNGVNYFVEADNNYKCIPYFVDNFMKAKNIPASDYNYFYPNTAYTGFNVADAIVTEQDIPAENGVIHIVNKVITALPSIDEYLAGKPEYSLFKSLFDRFLIQYIQNQAATTKYRNVTGSSDPVFTKVFNPTLAFALNNENFLKVQDNDAQSNCYSIFVPNNDALDKYIQEVLLEHYDNLETMPPQIIYDFINAHLWQTAVWPSKFRNTLNYVNEEARFDPASDIVEKKILSNGIFYGTKKVQESNVFTSVYGKAYLDPQYSMMIRLLNMELKQQVSNIFQQYTIFMISNEMFNRAGYKINIMVSNDINDQWEYTRPGDSAPTSSGGTTRVRLQRILNLHVIPNKALDDLAGEGALLTWGGEYIAYKNGTVYAPGNIDSGNVAIATGSKGAANGRVFYTDRLLEFSDALPGKHLEALGSAAGSAYNYFWEFLRNSSMWNASSKEIRGLANGSFYTFFIPSNDAIQKAVDDGYLPRKADGKPNFAPTDPLEQTKVVNFISYHFLDKRIIAADGIAQGPALNTILKKNNGEPATIGVSNAPGNLVLTDMEGRTAWVISSPGTFLSNRCMIHLTDNYLKYID